MKEEEFYIGYLPRMPRHLATAIRVFVAFLFISALVLIAVLSIGQRPFAASFFNFGEVKQFEGTVQDGAVPFLLVERIEGGAGIPIFDRYPLVGEGKHGLKGLVGLDGQRVTLSGKLMHRDDLKMIEVTEESIRLGRSGPNDYPHQTEALGPHTLRGEIVDSKCYLGVMNPGASKVHRDCASACIRGGVPPLFVVRDDDGNSSELWLVSKDDLPVNAAEILDFVAEPVEISGEVTRTGDQLFFRIDRAAIARLP